MTCNPDKVKEFTDHLIDITGRYVNLHYYLESFKTQYPNQWQQLQFPQENGPDGPAPGKPAIASNLENQFEQAERRCRYWWRLALTSQPDEVLRNIIGAVFRPSRIELIELLSFDFMGPDIWRYSIQSSVKAFGQAMYQQWRSMRAAEQVPRKS